MRSVRSVQLSQSGQPQFGQISSGEVGLVRSGQLVRSDHVNSVQVWSGRSGKIRLVTSDRSGQVNHNDQIRSGEFDQFRVSLERVVSSVRSGQTVQLDLVW